MTNELSLKSGKSAARTPPPGVEKRSGGTVYSTEKANAVVEPILEQVRGMIEEYREPDIPGSLNRLQMWMLRMEKGNLVDDRTPIYQNMARSTIQKSLWNRVYNSNQEMKGSFGSFRNEWYEVEEDQAKNWGPQSQFLPWTLDGPKKLHAVMSDKPARSQVDFGAIEQAMDHVAGLLPHRSIKRIPLKEAITGMGGNAKFALDTSTNAGFPSWLRDWYATTDEKLTDARVAVIRNVMEEASALYDAAKHAQSYKEVVTDFVGTASQRTVQKGPRPLMPNKDGVLKSKRLVIAMPKKETVAGKTIMAPLQQALSQVRNPSSGVRLIPAWSPQPTLDKNIQKFLEFAAHAGRTPLSGDISSFDSSLPPWFMWLVSQAMSKWMDETTANLFLGIMYSDIYRTSVICPSEVVEACPSSVKSGSIFTSLIGCIANYAIQIYGMYAGYYEIDQICVMGDDFIVDGEGVTPDSISKPFADLGMECNPSKQFCHPNMVHFLQRLHVLGAPGGQGSIFRVGGSLLSVEDDTQLKWDERNKYAYIFQALARLENAAFNPEYETLIEFARLGDERYHLGASMTTQEIVAGAGSYAERKLLEAVVKPWKSTGTGVPFDNWSVNRVLRGAAMPPIGKERFEFVYGIKYDKVPL
jgi:hypothetical protein